MAPQGHTSFSVRQEGFSGKEEEEGVRCGADAYRSDGSLQNRSCVELPVCEFYE